MSEPSDLLPPPLPPLETTPVKPTLGAAWSKFKSDMAVVKADHQAKVAEHDAKLAEKEVSRQTEADAPLRCPGKGWPRKCGSTQIHLSEKKFSAGKAVVGALLVGGIGLIAGAHGRNDVVLTCLKCGHRWTPGK